MTLTIKVPLREAEIARQELLNKNLLDTTHMVLREKDFLYIPIKEKFDSKYEIIIKKLQKIEKKETLKEILKGKFTDEEIESLKTAYDLVGDIAIIEIDHELEKKDKIIADAIMRTNPTIKTVLKKSGIHKGEFRTQDMIYVLGENRKETIHKENNVMLTLDVEKVYFSPRLSHERKRIYELVKKGEEILVMFSGAAPYPCVLSKNTKAKSIIGIELNPNGHKYGLLNVKLNKLTNVTLINGDVKTVVPKLNKKFDRILMPLPKSAEDFLDSALIASKKGTIIHFYDFLNENEFHLAHEKIDKACKKNNLKYKIISTNKCGQHAPRVFRICVDFEIV